MKNLKLSYEVILAIGHLYQVNIDVKIANNKSIDSGDFINSKGNEKKFNKKKIQTCDGVDKPPIVRYLPTFKSTTAAQLR